MTMDKIQQLVNFLAKSVEDNEKLAIPILKAKLDRFNRDYPEDKTIGSVLNIIEKLASNDTIFIRKAEFKSLYNKLFSRNTKFAELFQDELGVVQDNLSVPIIHERDDSSVNIHQMGDPILSNALNSVFDNSPLKMYSQELANKAIKSVSSTLNSWNLMPNSISIDNGNEKFLIIKANYETPKGITSIYVPIEIHDNNIVKASIFMGNSGPKELNNVSIKDYITKSAGTKSKINGELILGVITKATSENREVSGVELALTKLNSSRKVQSEFFDNQIVGQKMAEASVKDVELPKYDRYMSFEKTFTSPYGIASFQFTDNKVKIAKEHIVRQLMSFGYANPQVSVHSSNESSVFYGVSLDAGKVAFTVPVKMSKDNFVKPEMLLCNGSISEFSTDGINELYINNQTDYKIAASASPLFGLKPADLLNNIRSAMAEGNHSKAEDALNVLANTDNLESYAIGFKMFLGALSNKEEIKTSCSMITKNASSTHPICGHTGLPTHKVYQDKDGNCRPLFRRGMDETYEGACFNNSRIIG